VAVRRLADLVGDEFLVLGDHRVVEAAADEALHREEGALGIGHRLALGRLADQPLAVVGERDDRGRGALPFGVLDDLGVLSVHDSDARVGRAEIDADYLAHSLFSLRQIERVRCRPPADPLILIPVRYACPRRGSPAGLGFPRYIWTACMGRKPARAASSG